MPPFVVTSKDASYSRCCGQAISCIEPAVELHTQRKHFLFLFCASMWPEKAAFGRQGDIFFPMKRGLLPPLVRAAL